MLRGESTDGFEVQRQTSIRGLDGHDDPRDGRGHDGCAPLARVGRAAEDDPSSRGDCRADTGPVRRFGRGEQ